VGDGQGTVSAAFLAHAVGPNRIGEVRPIVVACGQGFPTGLEVFLPFSEPEESPERARGDEHAVVEVGTPGQRDDAFQFGSEGREFVMQLLQFGDAGCVARAAPLAGRSRPAQFDDLLSNGFQLGIYKVGDQPMECLISDPVVIEPDGVAAACGGERPVNGGSSLAVRIFAAMVLEKSTPQPRSKRLSPPRSSNW
jgi:hypothetical protein